MTTRLTSQPASIVLHLDDLCTQDPATSQKPGSFNYERKNGHFLYKWSNMAEFEVWSQEEELAYSIEFIATHVVQGDGLWTLRHHYVCSHQLLDNKVPYQKKRPDWKAIESKKMGCQCKIVIKCYPHMSIVCGQYEGDYNHKIGLSNIAFIQISTALWEQIRKLLEQKVDPREIISNC